MLVPYGWNKAQKRLEKRKEELENGINRRQDSHFFAGRVECGYCGGKYRRVKVGSKGKYEIVWKCKNRGRCCEGKIIKEKLLMEAVNAELGILGSEEADERHYRTVKQITVGEDGKIKVTV